MMITANIGPTPRAKIDTQIDTVKKSIHARTFRDGLDTNDPTDESAEELIKRVL